MTFAKKIEKIQNKPIQERKVILFVSTGLAFVVMVAVLYFAGAFTLPALQLSSSQADSIQDIANDFSQFADEVGDEFDAAVASSTEVLNDMQELASSTASTTDNMASSTAAVASTTHGEGIVHDTGTTTDFDEDESGTSTESQEDS